MGYISAESIFHAQEDPEFCGAAAALTMLSDQDIGLAVEDLSETDLFNIGHSKSRKGWKGIDPDGLVFLLNNPRSGSLPQGSPSIEFSKKDPGTEPEGTAQIVAAVSRSQAVAVAVLIHGIRHWVTVNGIEVDSDPLNGPYTLFKLWVFDPEAQVSPQPPHHDDDDCPRLAVNKFVVFYRPGWIKMFDGAFLGDKISFVSISRGAAQDILAPKYVQPPDVLLERDGHGLIRPEFIEAMWNVWVNALGGWPDGSPGVVLRNVKPVGFNKVTWLGGEDVLYLFLLEREAGLDGAGEIIATGVMDARSGSLHSIKIYSEQATHRKALERLRGDLSGADLVWQPCLESFSPHLPFRHFEDGSYERLDRQMFATLTVEVQGV